MKEIKIRNKRNKGWFYLDNEYLNGYARLMNPLASLVYISLCRHADNESQQCFPSMKLIAEELGISTKTVERCTKELQSWNIISIEKSKREDGTQAPNNYTLLDKEVWVKKPTDCESVSVDRQTVSPKPTDCESKSRQTVVLHKETHINYTHIKDTHIAGEPAKCSNLVSEVIKKMEGIDPKNKLYYGNVTQRKAAQFLIDNYGFESVINIITAIPELKTKVEYMPSVTTPCELRDKWQKIADAIQRSQVNKISKMQENLNSVIW